MGIKVGGIDLAKELINAEFRIGVLENLLEILINRVAPGTLTTEDIRLTKEKVFMQLQTKYPEAGLQKTGF